MDLYKLNVGYKRPNINKFIWTILYIYYFFETICTYNYYLNLNIFKMLHSDIRNQLGIITYFWLRKLFKLFIYIPIKMFFSMVVFAKKKNMKQLRYLMKFKILIIYVIYFNQSRIFYSLRLSNVVIEYESLS